MPPRFQDYLDREQTYVKHVVLEAYLQILAYKIGQSGRSATLNYIDGFAGPWESRAADLSDTSPFIATQILDGVRVDLAKRRVPLTVQCLFVEKRKGAVGQLAALRKRFPDVHVETIEGEFERNISNAVKFARSGRSPFPFVFIDPTGWTGYALKKIEPLINVRPCEVLVNFMTQHISRFVDEREPASLMEQFVDLFGSRDYCDAWRGLEGAEREQQIVATYCERLKAAGGFEHCAASVVANPASDRTHFHLVYATRNIHGLVAFRDAEHKANAAQQFGRATAKARAVEERSKQQALFAATALTPTDRYLDALRAASEATARKAVEADLRLRRRATYDGLVAIALAYPLVRVATLNRWLTSMKDARHVLFVGLGGGERVPKVSSGHMVEWIGGVTA